MSSSKSAAAFLPNFSLIVAETRNHGIGKDGDLPWRLPQEFHYFVQKTREPVGPGLVNACIMGRRSWDSIPASARPLVGRTTVVLSRHPEAREQSNIPPEVPVLPSLAEALHWLSHPARAATLGRVWILGGAAVYNEAARMQQCEAIYSTLIEHDFECDVHWDGVDPARFVEDESYTRVSGEKGISYRFMRFVRAPEHGELGYLRLVQHVLDAGVPQMDRTGVGTRALFGAQLRFDLRRGFPLLTTKKVYWHAIREELLWFIAGSTDATALAARGVHIWDGNASRAFLDGRGLNAYPEGQLGPVYGFQWRHFGASYQGAHADHAGQGVDQLAQCIAQIRGDPSSRRILLSAWNPVDLPKMALPPCHVLCQFHVANGALSCQLYQRSADLGLGVPFNIASYALLTHLVAHVCGLRVGEFVHTFGDYHVYNNHVLALQEQLTRSVHPFPRLVLRDAEAVREIDHFTSDHIVLENYVSHPPIKMDMAL